MPKIIDWTNEINYNELQEVVEILKQGGIVVFPTETVFGIACNAFSTKAVQKLYEAKKRPVNKPFSIFVSNKNEIEKIAKINNSIERKIIEKFMPGPITIILEKEKNVNTIVTANKSTVGVRIPDCEIVNAILKEVKLPLATSSANISGKQVETNFKNIVETFGNNVDVFINGGNMNLAQASTIVQVVNNEPIILRKGIISKEDINYSIKNAKI